MSERSGSRGHAAGDIEVTIRAEVPADHAAVFTVNSRAFGRRQEAELVDRLRPVARPQISLVAVRGGDVVGHIFFSPVSIRGDVTSTAIGLAPLAVLPEFQNHGIGAALVRAGLDACRGLGEMVVFVLGHPPYYPRFGFVPAGAHGLRYEERTPDDAFMVAELARGALAGRTGVVHYLPEFSAVE